MFKMHTHSSRRTKAENEHDEQVMMNTYYSGHNKL